MNSRLGDAEFERIVPNGVAGIPTFRQLGAGTDFAEGFAVQRDRERSDLRHGDEDGERVFSGNGKRNVVFDEHPLPGGVRIVRNDDRSAVSVFFQINLEVAPVERPGINVETLFRRRKAGRKKRQNKKNRVQSHRRKGG